MVCSTWQSDRSLSGYDKKLFLGSVSQNDGSVARTLRFWFVVRFSGLGRKVFLGSGSQNGGSAARNAPFDSLFELFHDICAIGLIVQLQDREEHHLLQFAQITCGFCHCFDLLSQSRYPITHYRRRNWKKGYIRFWFGWVFLESRPGADLRIVKLPGKTGVLCISTMDILEMDMYP